MAKLESKRNNNSQYTAHHARRPNLRTELPNSRFFHQTYYRCSCSLLLKTITVVCQLVSNFKKKLSIFSKKASRDVFGYIFQSDMRLNSLKSIKTDFHPKSPDSNVITLWIILFIYFLDHIHIEQSVGGLH